MKTLVKLLSGLGVCIALLGAVYFVFPGFIIGSVAFFARLSAGLERHEVMAAGHTWAYYDGGRGEPILLIHGFGLSRDMWGEILAAFTDRYRVIAPDFAGFGETGYNENDDYGLNRQTERLEEFVSKVGLDSFHLIGHSLGGGIAALYASRHAEKVRTLTLIAPFGVQSSVKSDYQKAFEKGENPLVFRTPEGFDLTMSYISNKPMQMPSHFKAHLAKKAEGAYDFYRNAVRKEIDAVGWDMLRRSLHAIKSPTLVLFGERDRVFDPSCANIFGKEIRNSRTRIIKNAGHMVYLDNPADTIRAMNEFLQGHIVR